MRNFLIILTITAIICGSVFIFKGYDKKDNYSDGSGYRRINYYVGGDAYNLIINASFFVGYMVLGIGCYILAFLSMIGAAFLTRLDDEKEKTASFHSKILKILQEEQIQTKVSNTRLNTPIPTKDQNTLQG